MRANRVGYDVGLNNPNTPDIHLLVKYFEQAAVDPPSLPRFRAKPALASHLTFERLNLLGPWPKRDPFDLIFCRNVLIYQNVENKKKIIARLADALAPGGYLILGGAESLLGLSTDFQMEHYGKACVYKLNARGRASA